jgi:hypothetical protein
MLEEERARREVGISIRPPEDHPFLKFQAVELPGFVSQSEQLLFLFSASW